MKADGRRWQQIRSAAAVLLLHAGLAALLIAGLGGPVAIERARRIATFDVPPTLPPPEPEPEPEPPEVVRDDEAAPSGVARRTVAEPTPVIAPTEGPDSPLLASPVVGSGDSPAGGGTGNEGSGIGAAGTGRGQDGGVASPARKIEGLISNRDYPRTARRTGAEGRVVSRIEVGADGRVHGCSTLLTSGHRELDRATCNLIQRRYRFAPARDEAGQPVPDIVNWETIWWLGR